MLQEPFYNPLKSYEDNYDFGPFGAFQNGVTVSDHPTAPRFEFLGQKINYPLGIPAGPLLNSKYVTAAFQKGFDVCVYKTVRSGVYPCHPFPNVLSVRVDGDLTYEKAKQPLVAEASYSEPLSITNSFGVPSRDPEVWMEDSQKAIQSQGYGQVMVLSFMGTAREGQSASDFIADFVKAGELAKKTGATILEANLSCPNIGNEGLVCYDLETTKWLVRTLRERLGSTPLILKVGYFQDEVELGELVSITTHYADAIASINTIAAPIVNNEGKQALPGSPLRMRSGVCGASIKWAGLEMVERLAKIREKRGVEFGIVGTGGVMKAADFREYRDRGADIVMTATGAMWNPYLAAEIKDTYPRG